MRMRLTILIAFALTYIPVTAQIENTFNFTCALNYVAPLGELGQVYKKTPSYQIGFTKEKKYKKKQSSNGIVLGYLAMDSKYDTLIYEIITDSGLEYGKIHYNTYYSFQLMYTAQHDYYFSKSISFFYGYEAGFHFNIYGHYLEDPFF
jgi:hypothetical protein